MMLTFPLALVHSNFWLAMLIARSLIRPEAAHFGLPYLFRHTQAVSVIAVKAKAVTTRIQNLECTAN